MNFLAHLFLSCEQEELLIGNFLADFVKNREASLLPEPVRQGIILHRKIDHYTDNHPLVRQGMRRLYPTHHKYAAVIIDVFYDYFLAKNWNHYHQQGLKDFTEDIYSVLQKNLPVMPEHVQYILPRMIADNWLRHYFTKEGLNKTFSRMKRRVSRPRWLEAAVESLERDEELLDEEFNLFFPDVIRYVKEECFCL